MGNKTIPVISSAKVMRIIVLGFLNASISTMLDSKRGRYIESISIFSPADIDSHSSEIPSNSSSICLIAPLIVVDN